jgi:hypothetical protein
MWSIQQFKLVYDRFQSSGLSVTDFCANECIHHSKFYYWKKKLIEQSQAREQPSDFVPIVFSGSNTQLPAKRKVQHKPVLEHNDPASGDVFEIVYPQPTDMRKGFYTLSGLVTDQMGQSVRSGDVFIFLNRHCTSLKALHMEHGGLNKLIYSRYLTD